jgi:hypothetical protein
MNGSFSLRSAHDPHATRLRAARYGGQAYELHATRLRATRYGAAGYH